MEAYAVTIGNFDGVHLGHQEVFRVLRAEAARAGVPSLAMTFRPHPQHALNPAKAPPLLLTYDEKVARMRAAGLDKVFEQPFGREFSSQDPEIFFRDHILRHLGARAVVVGYDFAFGRDRAGSQDVLRRLCQDAGIPLIVVPALQRSGAAVSSTRIRNHLLAGEVEAANDLLGYAFFYGGTVIRGDRRGRTLGFPTANLAVPSGQVGSKLVLPRGVYVTETVTTLSGRQSVHRSVTNLGLRPTFQKSGAEGESVPLIETHLLDFSDDLYGRTIEVRFMARIRPEMKFSGRDDLHAQILKDAKIAREYSPSSS